MEGSDPGFSSLIITLSAHPDLRASALHALAGRTDVQCGQLAQRWLPVVLESADPYGAFREIETLPGVELVEVVFVELPDSCPAGA